MRYRPVTIRTARLRILWTLWVLGAVVLCRVLLFVALVGAGAYAIIGAAALLLGFDAPPWFRVSAIIWAPSAAGYALGDFVSRMKSAWSREGRPPNLELVAGWNVGGLAMSERPSWLNTAAVFMVMGGILAADLAPLELTIELVGWLMSGEWHTLALAGGLALPLSVCLSVVGLLLCVEGRNLGDRSFRENAWFSIT